jgi:hypothetical protein
MKQKKRETGKSPVAAAPTGPQRKVWPWIAGVLGAGVIAFQVYGPVLNGPFLFDDEYLLQNRIRPNREVQNLVMLFARARTHDVQAFFDQRFVVLVNGHAGA